MKPEAEEREITREEVRKEFQLERMILFSDAVFAIVITLMAIEIRLPEHGRQRDEHEFIEGLRHLVPVLISYVVTFCFIGMMWYRHLQMFSLLKDYNKDLVIRNMAFLFCIGLFPFSASLVGSTHDNVQIPLFIYLGIILACKVTHHVLYDYIFRHPELRLNTNVENELIKLKKDRFITIILAAIFILITVTNVMIQNPELKTMATLWMLIFPVAFRIYKMKNPDPSV
jgi:uncharacterized membrane protein